MSATSRASDLRQTEGQSTLRVYGRALNFISEDVTGIWKAVYPCLCVQDSPYNPCNCPPWLWWLPTDMILSEGDAGRKDHDGNELRYFDVRLDSKIVVGTMQSVSASAIKKLRGKLTSAAIAGVADADGDSGGLGTIEMGPLVGGVIAGLITNVIWEGVKGLKNANWGKATPEERAWTCTNVLGNPPWAKVSGLCP